MIHYPAGHGGDGGEEQREDVLPSPDGVARSKGEVVDREAVLRLRAAALGHQQDDLRATLPPRQESLQAAGQRPPEAQERFAAIPQTTRATARRALQ